jgi:class 3 adenylate cyclase
MGDLLEFLTTPEGSFFVGGLVVAIAVQVWKRLFGTKPGDEAWKKRAVAIVAAMVVGFATTCESGEPLTWAALLTNVIAAFIGASGYHSVLLRSQESKAPGKVENVS